MGWGRGEAGGEQEGAKQGGSAKGRWGDEGRGESDGMRERQRGRQRRWALAWGGKGTQRLEVCVPLVLHLVQVSYCWLCWRRDV